VTGVESDAPSFIRYDKDTASLSVYTTDTAYAGDYYFKVYCTLDNSLQTTLGSSVFKLSVYAPPLEYRVPENKDPYFAEVPADMCMVVGEDWSYSFGPVSDIEGDEVTVTADLGLSAYFVQFLPSTNTF